MENPKNEDADSPNVSNDQQVEENVICLEEATIDRIPNSLKSLISLLPPDNLNEKEIFTIILYIASIENGFTWNKFELESVPSRRRNYHFDMRRLRSIPPESYTPWTDKSNSFEKVVYLGGVEDFQCTLVATPSQNNMIVNISNPIFLICFPSIFVLSDYIHRSKPKYDKIKELVAKFHFELFYPLKSHLLSKASIVNPSLIGLPLEIISKIAKNLDITDFVHLCFCCKYFYYNLSDLESVWIYFAKKLNVPVKPDDTDWKTHVIKAKLACVCNRPARPEYVPPPVRRFYAFRR